eukprot:758599-Hanusia_phi.AAC.6
MLPYRRGHGFAAAAGRLRRDRTVPPVGPPCVRRRSEQPARAGTLCSVKAACGRASKLKPGGPVTVVRQGGCIETPEMHARLLMLWGDILA